MMARSYVDRALVDEGGLAAMSEIDFAERMARVPDEELLAVLSGDGFVPAAVNAAKREIERRNLSSDNIRAMQAGLEAQSHFENEKPDLPLGWSGRVAFVVLGGFLVWSLFAVIRLRALGYRRKSNQALLCILASLIFWGAIGLVLTLAG